MVLYLIRSIGRQYKCQRLRNPLFPYCSIVKKFSISSAMSSAKVELIVNPIECQHDEPVNVKIKGLEPKQTVTLSAVVLDTKQNIFTSHGHYIANNQGLVDVNRMSCHGGNYKGLFPMGLLSSLLPGPDVKKFTRFFKQDVENPSEVIFHVQDGHISDSEIFEWDKHPILDTVKHIRHYMASGVQRILIKHDTVRGALFIPPGPGPFPGLIDMFGSAGGLLDFRAAQLASKGFVTLALPFFGYEDLPQDLSALNLDYFEAAVKYLLDREEVMKPNVGVIGVSKGADLALSMATFIPEVTACVSINGLVSSVEAKLTTKHGVIEGLKYDANKATIIDNQVIDCYEVMENPLDHPNTIIPIEKADAEFLFIVGGKDRNWKSSENMQLAVDILRKAGKSNFKILFYPEAGHLIEPPYSAFCNASFHKIIGAPLLWGGELQSHSEAQIHSWHGMIRFLRNNIPHYKQSKL